MHCGLEWTTIYIYTLLTSVLILTYGGYHLTKKLDKSMIPPTTIILELLPLKWKFIETKTCIVHMELRFPIFIKKMDKFHLSCTFSQEKRTVALKAKRTSSKEKVWQYHLKLLYKLHFKQDFQPIALFGENDRRRKNRSLWCNFVHMNILWETRKLAWRFVKWSQGSYCMGNVGKNTLDLDFYTAFIIAGYLCVYYVQWSTWIWLSCSFPEMKDFYFDIVWFMCNED
jgi:hypothetical protein